MIEPRLLSRREAAQVVGVGLTTFDEHVAPYLPAVRIGRRVMFRVRDVDAWIDSMAGDGCSSAIGGGGVDDCA